MHEICTNFNVNPTWIDIQHYILTFLLHFKVYGPYFYQHKITKYTIWKEMHEINPIWNKFKGCIWSRKALNCFGKWTFSLVPLQIFLWVGFHHRTPCDLAKLINIYVTVPLGLWMFERPGELRLNHSNVIFNYFYW